MTNEDQSRTNWAIQGKKNTLRLALWTLAWVLSVAVATFGPKFLWAQESLF